MNAELKSLIEDAAKLLGYTWSSAMYRWEKAGIGIVFDPLDPERGDLMKVAMALRLNLRLDGGWLIGPEIDVGFPFEPDDYQSLALAILRAASAVYKSRGGV